MQHSVGLLDIGNGSEKIAWKTLRVLLHKSEDNPNKVAVIYSCIASRCEFGGVGQIGRQPCLAFAEANNRQLVSRWPSLENYTHSHVECLLTINTMAAHQSGKRQRLDPSAR